MWVPPGPLRTTILVDARRWRVSKNRLPCSADTIPDTERRAGRKGELEMAAIEHVQGVVDDGRMRRISQAPGVDLCGGKPAFTCGHHVVDD